MGIRVECPNGHKLNVKDALAGRRGVCPDCGARVDIPAIASPLGSAFDAPAADASGQGAEAPPLANPTTATDAESALWYIRPAQGGQFGPATTEVVHQWVREGRITADSLVWRTGWPDWRPGTECLPLAPPPVPNATMIPEPPIPTSHAVGSEAMASSALGPMATLSPGAARASGTPLTAQDRERERKLRRRRRRQITVGMAVLVAVLASVLAFVLLNR